MNINLCLQNIALSKLYEKVAEAQIDQAICLNREINTRTKLIGEETSAVKRKITSAMKDRVINHAIRTVLDNGEMFHSLKLAAKNAEDCLKMARILDPTSGR